MYTKKLQLNKKKTTYYQLAKNLDRHFTNEESQMANRHMKGAQYHFSLEKCNLKSQ